MEEVEKKCKNCAYWTLNHAAYTDEEKVRCRINDEVLKNYEKGTCRRYPQEVEKVGGETCGEFQRGELSEELLQTDLDMLVVTPLARKCARHLNCETVEDLLLVGRVAFACSKERYAKTAIKEISYAMGRLGLKW